jgi:tRNA (guanine-N7-)-methyltransferase
MRTRKKKWTASELADNPLVLRTPAPRGEWARAFFNNANPIRLELGCGKGRFITEAAARSPRVNYVAVERDPTILAMAARLAREAPPANPPAFVCADASELASLFAPNEIARLYINFCDPWDRKKKWAKRRLTHADYLSIYESLSIPELFLKTDSRILFDFSLEQLSARGWALANVSRDLHSANPADNIVTEYEERLAERGPIYYLEAFMIYPPATA